MNLRCVAGALAIAFAFVACSDDGGSDAGTNPNRDGSTGDTGTGGVDSGTGGVDSGTGGMDSGTQMVTCDPAFGAAPECGGDPSGSWTYRAACGATAIEDGVRQQCQTATFQATSHQVSGTLNITGNTYTLNVTDNADVMMQIPQECATPLGGCAGVQTALSQGLNSPTTCNQNGTRCDCESSVTVSAAETGTYTTNGGTLTTMPSGGGASGTYYYCVENGVFRYREMGDGVVFVLTE
jgi:hypothetical protein